MKIIAAFCLLFGAYSCLAGSSSVDNIRFKCLAMLETGNKDHTIGRDGEVSRYQIKPSLWRQYASNLPLSAARNPDMAWQVAQAIMADRVRTFTVGHGRPPNQFEWAVLWHRPTRKHLTANDRDYATRFDNLCRNSL